MARTWVRLVTVRLTAAVAEAVAVAAADPAVAAAAATAVLRPRSRLLHRLPITILLTQPRPLTKTTVLTNYVTRRASGAASPPSHTGPLTSRMGLSVVRDTQPPKSPARLLHPEGSRAGLFLLVRSTRGGSPKCGTPAACRVKRHVWSLLPACYLQPLDGANQPWHNDDSCRAFIDNSPLWEDDTWTFNTPVLNLL